LYSLAGFCINLAWPVDGLNEMRAPMEGNLAGDLAVWAKVRSNWPEGQHRRKAEKGNLETF